MKLTWLQVEELCSNLAQQIRSSCGEELKDHLIIAVARGGLIPATILSYELKIPMAGIVYSYETRFHFAVHEEFYVPGRKKILVDDLADTGNTLKRLQRYMSGLFGVLLAKPLGGPFCTCIGRKCAQNIWVDFPWAPDDYKPEEHIPG